MGNWNYFQRVGRFLSNGFRASYGFTLALIYISSSLNALNLDAYDIGWDKPEFATVYWFSLVITNVVAYFAGLITLGLILPVITKPKGRFGSVFFGFIVGILILVATDFWFYTGWYKQEERSLVLFFEFLFGSNNWPWYFSPYLVPNLINLGSFTYISWTMTYSDRIKPSKNISTLFATLAAFSIISIFPLGILNLFLDEKSVFPILSITLFASYLSLSALISVMTIRLFRILKKNISNLDAITMSFLTGIAFVFLINYLLWSAIYPPDLRTRPWLNAPANVLEFAIHKMRFWLPNFLSILISLYVGWKTNKSLNSIFIQSEE
jgi:hypothetical protein